MIKIRKAQITTKLGTIIIAIAVLVLMLLFAIKLNEYFSKTDREICRTTVAGQSLLMQTPVPGSQNFINPDCKTYNVVFFNDHVEINDKAIKVYDSRKKDVVKKFNALTDDIVNKVIAEELRGCWYQFLEGKRSLWSLRLIFAGGGQSCFLCSEISFDSSVKKDQFKGFYEFTKSTTMPSSEITYYTYIAEQDRLSSLWHNTDDEKNSWEEYADGFDGILGSGISLKLGKCGNLIDYAIGEKRPAIETDIVFEKNKKYAVFFVREGQSSVVRKIAGEGDDPNCNDETYFAYVIPIDELPEQCESVKRGSMK